MSEGPSQTLLWSIAAAVFFCAAMGLTWFFTRKIPQKAAWHNGPEMEKQRLPYRTKVRLLVAIPIVVVSLMWVLLGLLMDAVTVSGPIIPDFDSDTWAAECGSAVGRQSVSQKKRHTLTYRCESFTGAHTLWRIYTESGGAEIEITYQLMVEEGRADLVLVEPDGTVTRLSGETSPYTFTADPGETRLRLIGDEGKLEFTVTIPSMRGQWMD